MKSITILLSRVKKDAFFQFNIFKSVLDWTVLLYIVIPFTIISAIIYRSWWIELPTWSEYMNMQMILLLVYLFCWNGHFRLFVKEADGVFLFKHNHLYIQLKKWAFFLAFVKLIAKMTLITIVLWPFLHVQFTLVHGEIASFLFLYIGLSFFITTLRETWLSKFISWKLQCLTFLLFLVLLVCNQLIFVHIIESVYYTVFISTLIIFLSLLLYKSRILTIHHFQQEVLKENEQRLRYMNMIFALSPEIEKPNIVKRKKPLLFRYSKRIFSKRNAQNGFLELFLKIVIRNFSYLSGYFRLVGITLGAVVVVTPFLFKGLIIGGFVWFLWQWVSGLYDRVILSHPLGKQFENRSSYYQSRVKACLVLSIPAFVLLFGILLTQMYLL